MTQTTTPRSVLICRNRACHHQGSDQVLAAFQHQTLPQDLELTEVKCLGQCGSGPMVLILPEETWYSQVDPAEVPTIVHQHLQSGQPVQHMLYAKFHPRQQRSWQLPFPSWSLAAVFAGGIIMVFLQIT